MSATGKSPTPSHELEQCRGHHTVDHFATSTNAMCQPAFTSASTENGPETLINPP
eukprot:m.2793 g.2793  ORF g.2793 m.2793 type:complete len:55 (-) comp3177_c0_seq1:132-296(-)